MCLRNIAGKIFSALIFFSLFFAPVIHAQGTGSIKGKVFDKTSKEELPGGNIVVRGTGIGTVTDLNGVFVLHNIPSGEQTIVVSYLGYVTTSMKVNIVEDSTLKLDFSLATTTLQGEEVIITAQGMGQIQAINQQLSSNKISNVVSEAKIQELPDFNAAAAIGRLPGVSTLQSSGEANKIVIRGLAPQYNQVSVGGITAASTGSSQIGVSSLGNTAGAVNNDRSVDLSMITPYMIKSIEVYKSLTPDMEANAIGGTVNLEFREAPSGIHGDALWQSGYTQKSNTYGNYRGVVSLSNRFFDEDLGIYVLGNAEAYDRNSDNMSASYVTANSTIGPSGFRPVRVTGVTLSRHIETRKRYGGNVILDYKLPNGIIKSVNMFSRLNSIYNDYNTTLNYGSSNYNVDFSYRQGDGNTDLGSNSLQIKNDFGFISIDAQASNSYSRNHLPLSPYFTFFQNDAISHQHSVTGDSMKVPEDLVHFVNFGDDSLTYLGSTNMFSSDYKENGQTYKVDLKIPVNVVSDLAGFIKFGGVYRYNQHQNDQSTPYVSIKRGTAGVDSPDRMVSDAILAKFPGLRFSSTGQLMASNFTSGDSKLFDAFLDDKFGAVYWAPDAGMLNSIVNFVSTNPALTAYNSLGGWFNGPYQNLPNDYKYIERYYAGYIMSELNFGTDLMVVGGARYEQTKGLFFAYNLRDERNPVTQKYSTVTVYPQNHYWLPMIQARYKFLEWGDVRYSYTQTLARPAYSQLTPHFTIGADSPLQINAGNPKLVPAQATNHDFFLTFHSNDLGLLSVGGFYKEISQFTYATTYQVYSKSVYDKFGITGLDSLNSFGLTSTNAGARLNTFINSRYKAYVRGIEADFQTRLWYLPSPFDGLVLGVNYTRIWSKASYPIYDVKASRGVITWYSDSIRVGRLVYQPNDIFNSYIGYDYKGFSARVSCLFQGNSVTFIGAYPEADGFSKDYFRVDASMKQMLPWEGIQLFLDVNNINSAQNISAQQTINGFTSQNHYGITANLGVRYAL